MNRADFYRIANHYIQIYDPISPEKLFTVGEVLGVNKNNRVIDFGSGSGELLALWAEKFGISGIGIDIGVNAYNRATAKMQGRDLSGRIEIIQADASKYPFEKHAFDAALCIGATFIWGAYREALHAMKEAIRPTGKLAIGEVYWLKGNVPQEYIATTAPKDTRYEHELLEITHEEGFDLQYLVRASHEDWDRYEAGKWRALVQWIDDNPDHPERQEVIDYLHRSQEEYLRYQREYLGWAIYVLSPMKY